MRQFERSMHNSFCCGTYPEDDGILAGFVRRISGYAMTHDIFDVYLSRSAGAWVRTQHWYLHRINPGA